MSKLKDLKLVTKVAEVDFPGLDGFKVKLSAISRPLSRKLQEDAQVSKFDSANRVSVKQLDEDLFIDNFVKAAIVGWSGLKLKYLEELMLVDLSKIDDPEGTGELEYTHEDAVELVKNSVAFDNWLNEVVFSLEQFRSK